MVKIKAVDVPFPDEKRPMAGRIPIPVSADPTNPTGLFWEGNVPFKGAGRLRFTVAVDERVVHQVAVHDAKTGELFGRIEILFACPGQVYGLDLTSGQTEAALRDGLSLSLIEPATPLWLVGPGGSHAPAALLPHIAPMAGDPNLDTFLDLYCSDASIQPCDWMGICVLDGLADWAAQGRTDAAQALSRQLDVYFHPKTGTRETFRSHPCDGKPSGPESTGPFAQLAVHRPQDPALKLAEACFQNTRIPELNIVGHNVVGETAYNIAYPMMAMAAASGKEEYRSQAMRQLEVLKECLVTPEMMWLRYFPKDRNRTFPGWSRGVAWYFLGMVRTLALMPENLRPSSLLQEISRMAEWVKPYQTANGLWPCFFEEPEILPDTSGSSGIAAAIAIAVREKMLDSTHFDTAHRAYESLLENYLDVDGWLRGTSQSNKRESEACDIQRIPYRVIAPWGMGLFAQLAAALHNT